MLLTTLDFPCLAPPQNLPHMPMTSRSWGNAQTSSRPPSPPCSVTSTLGLQFNGAKCAAITFTKGKVNASIPLRIDGKRIRTLEQGHNEKYLGVPIGSRILFRPASSIPDSLVKDADSDLAPWQMLEIFRSHLLPSISHHLVTGRVEKSFLYDLDKNCVLLSPSCCQRPTQRPQRFPVRRPTCWRPRRHSSL
jgi:hypothetical protein